MPRLPVTTLSIIEVAIALALLVVAAWLYSRRSAEQRYGSQSAVLLIAIAALMLIHGLGLLEYRPSTAELGR